MFTIENIKMAVKTGDEMKHMCPNRCGNFQTHEKRDPVSEIIRDNLIVVYIFNDALK